MTTPHSVCRLSQPAALAISMEECKNFLKIDYIEDDELLSKLISSASQKFENYTSQALVSQTWQVMYKQFSDDDVKLPTNPVTQVTKVETISYSGEHTIFDPKLYDFDQSTQRLTFKVFPFGYYLKIDYIAGYGIDSTKVPNDIKTALLNHIAYLYENRAISAQYPLSNYDEFKTMRL